MRLALLGITILCSGTLMASFDLTRCIAVENPELSILTCTSDCSYQLCQIKMLCKEKGAEKIYTLTCAQNGDGSCPKPKECLLDKTTEINRSTTLDHKGSSTSTQSEQK